MIISAPNDMRRNSSNEITRQTSHRHILMRSKATSGVPDVLQEAGYDHRSYSIMIVSTPPAAAHDVHRWRWGASGNIANLHGNHGNVITDEGMSSLALLPPENT
jgi:hypothetical protein